MSFKVTFGGGKTSGWGFGIDLDLYCHSLSISFIKWFIYVEIWKEDK